jgi:diacylglycerol kinase family enzyme
MMKHLFIINPKARGLAGKVDHVAREIRSFFLNYPNVRYDIHITRWKRDAVGYTRRYVFGAAEIVRVYAVGGTGTLFEVVNGVIGLPNVQVTMYPFGVDNAFLHCLGEENLELFRSLRNLVFSTSMALDVIRCGNNYGIGFGQIGVEAAATRQGDRIIARANLLRHEQFWTPGVYAFAAIYQAIYKDPVQHYRIDIDGTTLEGEYISILAANQPYYGINMKPAVEARPDDGLLDFYLVRPVLKPAFFKMTSDYIQGHYHKWPEAIFHYRGKRISVSSNEHMTVSLDGEMFFETTVHCEAIRQALVFAYPTGIDDSAGFFGQGDEPWRG